MVSEVILICLITGISTLLGALVGAIIAPFFNHNYRMQQLEKEHKYRVDYLKKEFFFKEKINLLEKVSKLSWNNHLALTIIEQKKEITKEEKEILKQKMREELSLIAQALEKIMYISDELRINLGKYISSFEEYINDSKFGERVRTKKLRQDYNPYMKKINEIINKEINS